MSAADDLHEQLFGFRPAKEGVAYERLAAMVFAAMGWNNVVHDTIEQPEGKNAKHQLDVTARHPDGEVQRLLIECKDYDKTVGQETLDRLVGVRNQVGADGAAVVTTKGLTRGALAVAVDEDIALVRLRRYEEEVDAGRFVERVEVALNIQVPSIDDLSLVLDPTGDLPAEAKVQVSIGSGTQLLHRDGTPAETVDDLLAASSAQLGEEGMFEHTADLADGRMITALDGTLIPILGLKWKETVHLTEERIVTERKGEPCLVLEQLDGDGQSFRGRLFVDAHLYGWEIDDDGNVSPRGTLLSRSAAAPGGSEAAD